MSKKLIYFRIIIVIICFILIGLFIFIIRNIHNSTVINEKIIEETVEDRIVFNMNLPPSKQKNLKGNIKEYLSQVYDYLYKDEKWKNIQESEPYNYSELKQKKDRDRFYQVLQYSKYGKLFLVLFNSDNKDIYRMIYLNYPLNMDDLPVTENYKQKHPNPLYEEFNFIKKDNYKYPKVYYSEIMDFDYWYEFGYNYHIGVDEENKTICVGEDKYCNKVHKDRETGIETSGIVRDKEGNEAPIDVRTRNFYFTYTTDEKGYVDDIVYDRTEIINNDKYLDNMIKYE